MKRICKINGLDCPNCARNLQNEINKLEDVNNASIDFVKSTLSYESSNLDKALKNIIALTKKMEPEATIISDSEKSKNNKPIYDIVVLILGVVLGIISCLLNQNTAIYWIIFILSILLLGYKTYYKAIVLLSKGIINENLLLTISVIGATLLNENMEAFMVIGLYSIGKIFEGLAVSKSRNAIEEITNLQPEYATILDGDKEVKVGPSEVKVGSKIIVKPGEKVAIDGIVIEGRASLDMQSLTGESLPVSIKENEKIMSGSIVLDSVLIIETTSEYKDSTVSKVMNMIEHASEKKSKTETLISRITRWYTLGVILSSVIVFLLVWLITNNIDTGVYRGLIFLVVSCPCAFAISVPLTYFSGIGNASKQGILIKGSNYLDACSKINLIAFDKTGTLTTGKFKVEKITSFKEELTSEDIIYLSSLGEQNSLHPLAIAIVEFNKKKLDKVTNVKEVSGEGVYFTYNKSNYFVGRKSKENEVTIVELFKDEDKLGEIVLKDEVKENSKSAIKELKTLNIKTVLLSGDNKKSVSEVISKLELDEGYSELLPQDKFSFIEDNKKKHNNFIGYVGDGINDAPSLMLADVGFSMGINGSSNSIEASDIVIVDDNPSKVATAIKISKYTQKIVWENIILSAGIKFLFLFLGTIGVTGMLAAVFADVGVTLLAIINSTRALNYNNVKKS